MPAHRHPHPEQPAYQAALLTLTSAVFVPLRGRRLGPISCQVPPKARLGVSTPLPGQWETLCEALSGRLAPRQGSLTEPERVVVQTDRRIWEMMTPERTLKDSLDAPDAPTHVWLENRRRSIEVLLGYLDLLGQRSRTPFGLLSPAFQHRVWAFRFLVSRARLLLARDLVAVEDPLVRKAFALRQADLPGTLVVSLPEGGWLPGVRPWLAFDSTGAARETPPTPG